VTRAAPRAVRLERESTLLVVADDPERTLQRIAALRALGGHVLRPRGMERLRDVYLDTPDGRLAARGIALRTRQTGRGAQLVTLKGPTAGDPETGAARPELELAAGARATARVREALERMGVRREGGSAAPAADLRRALGLVEVQRRVTRRTVRDVFAPGPRPGPPLAELALDRVTYRFGDREARLFEVEIEALRKDGGAAVKAVRRALLERFGDALRPWDYSKLATGRALARRNGLGRLAEWLGEGARLKRSAVPRLARSLARA